MLKRNEKAVNLKAFRLEENLFAVESSEGENFYRVMKENGSSTCVCSDFKTHHGENGWKCKHILAVEQFQKNNPDNSSKNCSSCKHQGINRKLLETPFEASQIKQRKGAYGDMLDYIEGHAVIKRLNDAFNGMWSFEIVSHKVLEEEVIVLGKLKAEYCISKMQFGTSKITLTRNDKLPVCLGDDLKAAATDALKKAATHFGVGLHLYEDKHTKENPNNGSAQRKREEPQDTYQPQRLTNRQLTAIYSIAKEKGMSGKDVEQRVLNTFKKKPEYLNKQEASEVIKQLYELKANGKK